MKLPRSRFLWFVTLGFTALARLGAAEGAGTPAGYWEGTVSLPQRELEVRVELDNGSGGWKGTIDIPMQGLRGFALDRVKVDGASAEFALSTLPGEPRFSGKLAADGKTMEGSFSQGSGSTTFRLERKPKRAPEPRDETPAQGIAGKGLAGRWRGTLKPLPGVELRLVLEVTSPAANQFEGALVSLDQGNARIAATALSEQDGAVRFETPQVSGSYEGKMNADGSEIVGNWSQGGRTSPLVFKRVPPTKP